jgi:soluble lytic murein transglycosylase-like protein
METILALLMQIQLQKHLAKDAVKAPLLAQAIVATSAHYGVDEQLVMQIVVVESRGREKAFNKRTKDFGLMQINKATAALYGFKESCLMNWRCNLEAGIIILRDLQDYKKYRPCTYNVGPRWAKKEKACHRYEKALALIN